MTRRLMILLCLFQKVWAVPAVVNHVKCAGNPCTTSAINMTGATLLVACTQDVGAPGSLTDSSSNVWTGLTAQGAVNPHEKMYYVASPTTSATQTFTNDANGFGLIVMGFNGTLASSPFDQQNGNAGTAASTGQPGSITPGFNGELLVVCLAGTMDATTAIDSGFSFLETDAYDGATTYGGGGAWFVQTTAAAINPTMTFNNPSTFATTIASFQAVGGAADGTLPLLGN